MSKTRSGLGLLVAALTLACQERPPAVSSNHDLAGAWRVEIQFQSGDFAAIRDLQFMTVFNQGGTLTESSNYDGAPPVPPAYGIWRATGPDAFEAKYEFFVTKAPAAIADLTTGGGWLPAGRGVFTETIQLSRDGSAYRSQIHYAAYDSLGQARAGGGEAEGRGVRIAF
jgi:hypothetical protein